MSGKCVCDKIAGCDDCTYDSTKCLKCTGSKFINTAVSPHTCVDVCPANTH